MIEPGDLQVCKRKEEVYTSAIPEHQGKIIVLYHIELEKEPPSKHMASSVFHGFSRNILPAATREESPGQQLAFQSHASLDQIRPAKQFRSSVLILIRIPLHWYSELIAILWIGEGGQALHRDMKHGIPSLRRQVFGERRLG